MSEAHVNLRRQPLPSAKRLPSDKFRYAGTMVALAAAAALAFAFMLRQAPDASQEITPRDGELPQINEG